jgi:NhaP-type Na+/H+ or K+/H+ antiporter
VFLGALRALIGKQKMTRPKTKFARILFPVLWLAVVCGAVILAIKRNEQGIDLYIIIGIALGMLVLFAVGYLPQKLRKEPFTELVGHLFVGFLILVAILTLATALAKGYERFGIFGAAVLVLFLITFIRIFFDYVKDFRKNARKRRS